MSDPLVHPQPSEEAKARTAVVTQALRDVKLCLNAGNDIGAAARIEQHLTHWGDRVSAQALERAAKIADAVASSTAEAIAETPGSSPLLTMRKGAAREIAASLRALIPGGK